MHHQYWRVRFLQARTLHALKRAKDRRTVAGVCGETGLDDHEFIVAYETETLERHQDLVIALRSTEARRYTLRDTPIFTAVHRPIGDALALLG